MTDHDARRGAPPDVVTDVRDACKILGKLAGNWQLKFLMQANLFWAFQDLMMPLFR